MQDDQARTEQLHAIQQSYDETERSPAPARTDYFGTMFEWKMLAEAYPPAAQALARARDEQARRLLAGERYTGTSQGGDDGQEMFQRVSRFSMIVDMNDTLADPAATHALFLQLERQCPALARRYAWQALPALVEVGDFVRADRYRGDPLEGLGAVNDAAATSQLFPSGRQAPRLAAELMNLTRETRIGIAVLRGLGRAGEADGLREALSRGLASEELRALAGRELDEPGAISRLVGEHQAMAWDADKAG